MALFTAVLAYLESLGPGAGYLVLLLASGFVFVCMVVLSFAGGDAPDGSGDAYDGHFDGAPPEHPHDAAANGENGAASDAAGADADHGIDLFKYLSFRNCINYLLGFGFCGFLASRGGAHPFVSALFALSGGFLSAVIMYKLMTALYALSDTQPLRMQDALGETAKVYIQINAKRSGRGKILLKVKGAQREFFAVTDNAAVLRAGTIVRVMGITGDGYVVAPVEEGAGESTSA